MDNERRKCIAVVISKPERKYQEGLLKGICKSAFANGMNVAVFATTLMEGMEEYLWGEQQIYDLIQFERFAGIVYAIDSFYGNDCTEELSGKLIAVAKKGIPVVAIDGVVPGMPSYFNDDSNAVEDIINHLVGEHELTDIAYMTGHKGHPHAENSLRAYKETMEKLGLCVCEDRTYYGDYWYNEAENFVNLLSESEKGLPQAIVCANEYMAIGAYRALHKRGVYMPKHIKLACTSNNAATAPYFLTAENNLENVGFEACEKILRVLCGEELGEEKKYFPCKNTLMTSVGCGCQKASAYDYSEERGVLIDTDPGYFGECNFYREGMLSKKDYYSLFKTFDEHTRYIQGFQSIHMCMCEGWDDPNFLINDTKKNPYTNRMQLYFSRRESAEGPKVFIGENKYFPKEEMFPDLFTDEGEPSLYLFRALHFLDRNFGYVVIDNGKSPKVYDYTFNFWLHDVTNALESQCRLQSVNYMFYTDIMTGLYNRNGFNTMLTDVLRDAVETKKQVLVALADLNCLKTINDTYGHEEGDVAIKAGAAILKQQKIECAVYEKNFRIGGDEFVKIAVGVFDEAVVERFKEELYTAVQDFSMHSGKPYKFEMSIGFCYSCISSMEEIDLLMSRADKKMYEEKQRLKSKTGKQDR